MSFYQIARALESALSKEMSTHVRADVIRALGALRRDLQISLPERSMAFRLSDLVDRVEGLDWSRSRPDTRSRLEDILAAVRISLRRAAPPMRSTPAKEFAFDHVEDFSLRELTDYMAFVAPTADFYLELQREAGALCLQVQGRGAGFSSATEAARRWAESRGLEFIMTP